MSRSTCILHDFRCRMQMLLLLFWQLLNFVFTLLLGKYTMPHFLLSLSLKLKGLRDNFVWFIMFLSECSFLTFILKGLLGLHFERLPSSHHSTRFLKDSIFTANVFKETLRRKQVFKTVLKWSPLAHSFIHGARYIALVSFDVTNNSELLAKSSPVRGMLDVGMLINVYQILILFSISIPWVWNIFVNGTVSNGLSVWEQLWPVYKQTCGFKANYDIFVIYLSKALQYIVKIMLNFTRLH